VALKSKVWGAGVYGVDAIGDMGIDLAKRGSHCTIRNEIIFDHEFCPLFQMFGLRYGSFLTRVISMFGALH
jgi:hypothetical protein